MIYLIQNIYNNNFFYRGGNSIVVVLGVIQSMSVICRIESTDLHQDWLLSRTLRHVPITTIGALRNTSKEVTLRFSIHIKKLHRNIPSIDSIAPALLQSVVGGVRINNLQ